MHAFVALEAHVPAGAEWLTPAEEARAAGMVYTKRRTEYLLRRLAGKRAVAAHVWGAGDATPTELRRIAVLNRPGGAPYALIDDHPAGVDVSLTDRAGAALALLAPDDAGLAGTLGIDVELVEPRSAAFVRDYLTPREQAYVAQAAAASQDGHAVAANLLWSAKEAALKVLWVGLRADTRRVDVHVTHEAGPYGWSPLRVVADDTHAFPGWWRRDGAYLLTLCTRRPTPPPAFLPGSADLAAAQPVHSWLAAPLTRTAGDPGRGARA